MSGAGDTNGRGPLLAVSGVTAGYGAVTALRDVGFQMDEAEAVSIVGPNGAGKTTLFRVLGGLLTPRGGTVTFAGRDITKMSTRARAEIGLVHVPEGAQSFSPLSVEENLEVPLIALGRKFVNGAFDDVFGLFPILERRRTQAAGTLSGGELRMLAIARGMMLSPKLLLLDEPTLGLSQAAGHQLAEALGELNARGVALVISEQNLAFAERTSKRGLLMERGRIRWSGSSTELRTSSEVASAVLGRGLEQLEQIDDPVGS